MGRCVDLMAGWQWCSTASGSLLRTGLQYYNGETSQYAFFNRHEELIGLGMWYDF